MSAPLPPAGPNPYAGLYQNRQFGASYLTQVPFYITQYLQSPPTSLVAAMNVNPLESETDFFALQTQTITVVGNPTGGSFKLEYGGLTTVPIAYNATATTVKAALISLTRIGVSEVQSATITGGPTGGTFTLTFSGQTTVALPFNVAPAYMQAALNGLSSVTAPAGGVNAVQTVNFGGTPSGGTFTLTFNGSTTAPIAWNAANSAVQTALTNLTNIGTGNVVVTGGPGPASYTITFAGALSYAPQPLITANGALLTGTSPTVTVANTTTGVVGTPNVTVAASAVANQYLITFTQLMAGVNQPAITASSSLTGGSSPGVTMATVTDGSNNLNVTGGPGPGTPWVATFTGTFVGGFVELIKIASLNLTGGTRPSVAISSPGQQAGIIPF